MYIVLAVLTFSFLIAFHELGHMWVARRMGMRVERYSIGFGPVLFAWRRGETEYVLSALPLGGYVKVAGMAVEDDVDPNDESNYANKPAWRRLLVIVAGPAANYLLAFIVGVGLLMAGVQEYNFHAAKIGDIEPGYPAAKAGMLPGDEIRAVGNIDVHDWQSMKDAITTTAKAHKGQPIPMTVIRGGQMQTLMIEPKESGESFVIGVAPSTLQEPGLPFTEALPQEFRTIADQTVFNAQMIGQLVTRKVGLGQLSGPIGIVSATVEQAKKGLMDLLKLFWSLSIAVGFFNLLPIPGLDGGRLTFLVYEVIARRRVNQRVEGIIHMVGMVGLLLLIVVVSWGDIMRKIHGG